MASNTSGKRDYIGAPAVFTVTNYTEDLSLSGTEAGAANVAASLATLIVALQKKGIIDGTWTA